jgi:membrane associated rhomboid family serine protease
MQQRTTFDLGGFLRQGRCPATIGLIIANAVTFLTWFFTRSSLVGEFTFSTEAVAARPWSLLTYPLISCCRPFWVLLACYMLWLFGGSLERAWGTPRFLKFFAAVTVITSGSVWIGSRLLHTPGALVGLGLPLSALVVAWCLMNWEATVLFCFVLPIPARYLIWIDVGLTFFDYGVDYDPWLAFFALAGCGFAYLYLRGLPQWFPIRVQRPSRSQPRSRPLEFDGPARPRPRKSWNPVTLFQRWQRKRRFKRLWEDSGMDEMFRDSDPHKPR